MTQHEQASPLHRTAEQRLNARLTAALLAVIVVMGIFAWSVDFVTLEGDYTIYTVECADGTWVGNRCTGSLRAGDRVVVQAVKAQREVRFWTPGATTPVAILTNCEVISDRNWSCPASPDASKAIALQMVRGHPVVDAQRRTRDVYSIPKLRWLLLRAGIGWGSEANE